ncbi:MAG: flippase-like domain-containing protein [Gemmatimonadales bacterium]|nr:flippase-like domain-containing protein [Gemmatimonadales bacterium]
MSTTADASGGTARRWVMTVIGLAISIALLAWALRDTSLSEVLAHFKSARLGPLGASVSVATLVFGIRTIRWRYLLRRPDGRPVAWPALWHATAMGFMANNTLPFRLGELVRSYAVSRLGQVSLPMAFSSVAVERALDGMTLLGLLVVALVRARLPADTMIMGARLDLAAGRAAVVCAVILLGAIIVVALPRFTERMARRVVPFHGVAERLVGLLESLRGGFSALRSPARLAAAVAWSVVHWLVNALSFYLAFAAFGIEVGFTGALLVQGIVAFAIAAPSTPGYFGVFEFFVAAGLALFGVPKDVGIAYGITYHITTFIPITLLGLYSLVTTGLQVKDARAARV